MTISIKAELTAGTKSNRLHIITYFALGFSNSLNMVKWLVRLMRITYAFNLSCLLNESSKRRDLEL
jgi:hypothetical protein